MKAENWLELKKEIHSLKGSSGYIGAIGKLIKNRFLKSLSIFIR